MYQNSKIVFKLDVPGKAACSSLWTAFIFI